MIVYHKRRWRCGRYRREQINVVDGCSRVRNFETGSYQVAWISILVNAKLLITDE
jgi:hypothetical protein